MSRIDYLYNRHKSIYVTNNMIQNAVNCKNKFISKEGLFQCMNDFESDCNIHCMNREIQPPTIPCNLVCRYSTFNLSTDPLFDLSKK